VLRTRGVAPAPGTNLGTDPLARVGRGADLTVELSEITSLADDLGVRAIVVDGTLAHAAGAGDVVELGYTLAAGAEYLRLLTRAGMSVRDALRLIEFRYAATGEQFVTIAKFRAARKLWHRVAELSGAEPGDRAQSQHAVTSGPMMTRYDPWVNLMRTTVAAFAAGIGGADAVTVLPFDAALGVPEALGRRLARNISSLLISEAHVAEVADPAAGAYAVELLTAQIADAAWAEFARIERDGGISQVVGDGSLHARWASTARERRVRIAHRRIPITGVSEFPHRDEVLPQRTPPAPVGHGERWATEFEDLRDHPAAGPVFLATLGPLAEHTARASFAANLFTAGGADTVTAGPTSNAKDVVDAYRPTRAPVACLAGTDAAYGNLGPEVITALRAAGARWVVLAGRPAADLAELIDDHIATGEDALGFLRRTRAHLEPAGVTR
jgi:methylmalonyl-CoA mutase